MVFACFYSQRQVVQNKKKDESQKKGENQCPGLRYDTIANFTLIDPIAFLPVVVDTSES
jgi:hypothetical protein